MEKVNLTLIDKNPDIKNFIYPGVPEDQIQSIKRSFQESKVIEFTYDEGVVLVSASEIHSLVFTSYISMEDLENPTEEQE